MLPLRSTFIPSVLPARTWSVSDVSTLETRMSGVVLPERSATRTDAGSPAVGRNRDGLPGVSYWSKLAYLSGTACS